MSKIIMLPFIRIHFRSILYIAEFLLFSRVTKTLALADTTISSDVLNHQTSLNEISINRGLFDYDIRKQYWSQKIQQKRFNELEFVIGQNEKLSEIKPISLRPSYIQYDGRDVLFFLFHGCNQNGKSWYQLPEKLKFLEQMRVRGVQPISVTSPLGAQHNYCWPQDDESVRKIALAVRMFVHKGHHIRNSTVTGSGCESSLSCTQVTPDKAPLVLCAGVGSGGQLVANLAKFDAQLCNGLAIYLSATSFKDVQSVREVPGLTQIPTTFIYMPRDINTVSPFSVTKIATAFEIFQLIPIKPRGLCMNPLPSEDALVTPNSAMTGRVSTSNAVRNSNNIGSNSDSNAAPCTPGEDYKVLSKDEIEKLKEINLVESQTDTGLLNVIDDPQKMVQVWTKALGITPQSEKASAIGELLNVCWGIHEFSGSRAKDVITFLLQKNGIATA